MEVRSQNLIMWYAKEVGRASVEAETTGVPSKPGKDPVKSFTRQRGSSGSRYSILGAAG